MDKQTLVKVSEIVAFDSIPKPTKDEKLESYVQRAYPVFEVAVTKSNNPHISEIADDSKKELQNAVSKLAVRHRLTTLYVMENDPFELEAPKEATDADILKFNGVPSSPKDLKKVMGEEAFADYIKRLKTPKKDGLSKREVDEKRDQHYAKYQPLFPSEKSYSHNTGGSTFGYHWQASIQDQYIEDHANFLQHFGLSDSFPKVKEVKAEAEPVEAKS